MRGQYLEPVTEDLKEKFLDLVAEGYDRPAAAKALGTSARVMRSICSPDSHRYDPDFARRYAKLTEKGGEHEQGLIERLRSAGIERAVTHSDRLLEKYSVIYDPEWHVHRPQTMQINFNIDKIRAEISAEFSKFPKEELQAYVEKKRAELEQGDVIDVDAEEL